MFNDKIAKHVNVLDNFAAQKLGLEVYRLGRPEGADSGNGVDLICIGTDRATGDSLGPLVGELMRKRLLQFGGLVRLFGTLDSPVHGLNLDDIVVKTAATGRLIIAVDACLGRSGNVGNITIGLGSVWPGACLSKDLPPVGDIFITGVVNSRSEQTGMEGITLQSTRLAVVMRMARVISRGLLFGLGMLSYERDIIPEDRNASDYYYYSADRS